VDWYMCWNKQLVLILAILGHNKLNGQVTQLTTHKYGTYLSCGLSTGKRIQAEGTGSIAFKTPGRAISMGASYARNISEFFWFQTGLDVHAREWKWDCSGNSGKIYYPSTTNISRETWLTAPLQALIYTGHEQGRFFIAAGPCVSMLLHKSWQELSVLSEEGQLSITHNESKLAIPVHLGFTAGIGSEIELNPFLICRAQLQTQNQWYKRNEAGHENSSAWQLSLSVLWSK
jgi:hypothetical protein